jgi:DNA invertase Pin-like site-specific DNA recombinase
MRAIIYLRVSTHAQKELGFGLQAQRKMCELEAKIRGITKKLIFSDAISGGMEVWIRPGLSDALLALKKGDVLMVSHRDRLARNIQVIADIMRILRNTKATLVVAGEQRSEQKSLLLETTLADVLAQHEQKIIQTRTRNALQVMKSQNRRIGNVPFGLQVAADKKHLEPSNIEQEIIQQAQKLSSLKLPLAAIAKEINERGFVSRTGTPFKTIQVKRMIQLPTWQAKADIGQSSGKISTAPRDLNRFVISLRLKEYSIGAIAREANKQGFTSKKGTALRNTQISRILQKAHLVMPNNRFVPYGFKISSSGQLAECPQEQALILLVQTLRNQNYSLDDILQHVNHHGHTSRAGKPFHITQIVRMLDKQLV